MFDWEDLREEKEDAPAEPKPADLASLSVKELKQRLKDAGISIPPGVAEKAELVSLLRAGGPPAPSSAQPPPPTPAAAPPPPTSAPQALSTMEAGPAPATLWRCVIKPRMIIRERTDTAAPAVRTLKFGEEIECLGEPVNGWLTVKAGGFAMVVHEKLGTLLERLNSHLTIKIFVDRGNDVFSELTVPRRSLAVELKQQLAESDPTGSTKPEDFYLSQPGAPGEPAKAVADGTQLVEEHCELDVVARTGGGGGGGGGDVVERPTVDWEAVREESERKILASIGRPYEVLDLAPGAKSADVRRAYHRLSLLHHPDKGGDANVFKAVGDAYKALSQASDESGGWRDLEGQAVGPWNGHTRMVKGVNVLMFDHFSCPPWESRRLYSGAFQEGGVRCWELSKGEPGKDKPPPRLLGEIHSGGFLNDVALLSPFGLLTAQSAGMKPQPGESLRMWNLNITPFRISHKPKKAIGDGEDGSAPASLTDGQAPAAGNTAISVAKQEINDEGLEGYEPPAHATEDILKSTMIYQHYRGVRSISVWPGPKQQRGAVPQMAATISKDWMALWRIDMQGLGLENPCVWKVQDPTGGTDPCVLKHETIDRLWSSSNDGVLKSWDVNTSTKPLTACHSKSNGSITGLELWPTQGVLVYSHSAGLGFFDMRANKVIRNQFTKSKVGGLASVSFQSPTLFAGIGRDLMQYDTRLFREGIDSKPKAVGSWTLRGDISAVTSTETNKNHILVAVGCENGQVAAFDST